MDRETTASEDICAALIRLSDELVDGERPRIGQLVYRAIKEASGGSVFEEKLFMISDDELRDILVNKLYEAWKASGEGK